MAENLYPRYRGRGRGNFRRNNFFRQKSCERLNGNDFLVPDEGQHFPQIFFGMGETYNGNQFQRGRISNRKHQEKKTFKANNAHETKSMINESELYDVMRRTWKPYEAQSSVSENEISQCKSSQSCSVSETSASEDREENFRRRNSFNEQRPFTDNESVNSTGSSCKETKRYQRGRKQSNFRRDNKINEQQIQNFRRQNFTKERRYDTDNESIQSTGSANAYRQTKNELPIQVPLFDSWHDPRHFIEVKNGKLKIIEETSDLIKQITSPSVVVSITGSYREGKSYLMNRIARKLKGFSTSNALQTHTKGIWIWCLPHPTKSQAALILLDTEGLDNAEEVIFRFLLSKQILFPYFFLNPHTEMVYKIINYESRKDMCNADQDTKIMALLMLISSSFIYNTIGKIDAKLIEKLHFVVDVVNKIKVRNSDKEEKTCCDYMMHFPNFILAIRDFYLDLELNHKIVTPDEYFDNMLKMKTGEDSNSPYNLPRTVIRTAFKTHHCFVFPRPVNDDKMLKLLKNLGDGKLNPDFVQEIKKFTEFVHEKSPIKRISEYEEMTGSLLKSFTETCIEALNSTGSNFYIEKITDSVRKQRDSEIVEEAFSVYKQEINKLNCPVINNTFVRFHRNAANKSIKFFCNNISSRELESQMKILQGKILEKSKEKRNYNDQLSFNKCKFTLEDLYLQKIGKTNMFSGSYSEYECLMDVILTEYNSQCGRLDGSIAAKNEFLKSKETERVKVLKSDIKMTPVEIRLKELEQKLGEKKMKVTDMEKINQADTEEEKFKKKLNKDIKAIITSRHEKLESKLDEITTILKKEERKFEKEGFIREAREVKCKIEEMDRKNTWKIVAGCLVGGVAVGVCAALCFPAVIGALAAVPPTTWITAIGAIGTIIHKLKS